MGNCLYVVGGNAEGAQTANVELLDMTQPNAEWTPCADMSDTRSFLTAVSVKSFLYAVGGCNQAGDRLNTMERYDVAMDAWTACAHMRHPLTEHAAVVLNDLIYVLGGAIVGHGRITRVADVDRYDPAKDTWTVCAPMSSPRSDFAAATIGDTIVVAGGFDKTNKPLASAERYNPVTNTWTACAPMPTARAAMGGCAVGAVFWVFSLGLLCATSHFLYSTLGLLRNGCKSLFFHDSIRIYDFVDSRGVHFDARVLGVSC